MQPTLNSAAEFIWTAEEGKVYSRKNPGVLAEWMHARVFGLKWLVATGKNNAKRSSP
jgi:hypothetical protein